MPQLTFIDVQSEPQQNLIKVKQHAAFVKHRHLPQISSCRYEATQPFQRQIPLPGPSTRQPSHNEVSLRDIVTGEASWDDVLHDGDNHPKHPNHKSERKKDQKSMTKQKMKSFQRRWRVGQPTTITTTASSQGPTSIVPPDDMHVIELALSQASNWMIGQFSTTWKSQVTNNSMIFDLDNGVEIVRESFFVVSDLLSSGKETLAFSALNHLLNTMPHFLRDPHPELFFCLMELSAGINMLKTPTLHTKVKTHVADISSIVLGINHPITVMLRCNFGQGRHTYATELVFACIVDTLSKTFGPGAYQTLIHQFGRSQFYAGSGRVDLGQLLITDVCERFTETYGGGSALAKLAEFELRKMQIQASKTQKGGDEGEHMSSVQALACNAMLGVESTIGVFDWTKFHPVVVEVPQQRSGRSLRLARHLLEMKRYTLALHVYAHAEDSASEGDDDERLLPKQNRALADQITSSVGAAIGDE